MSPKRFLAAAFVLAALSTLALMAFGGAPDPEPVEAAPLPPPVTTSSEADFAAIVESDVVTAPLSEEEQALTELAQTRTTTTTLAESTTTVPPETATTEANQQPSSTASPSTTPTTTPPTTSPPTTSPGGYDAGAENEFHSLINSRRASDGIGSLARNGSLDSHARAWAKQMAANGSIGHSSFGSLLPPWSAVGENVGSGGSVSAVFNALVASSSHLANIVGDYTHVGIGVWRDSEGVLWTCHVFAR